MTIQATGAMALVVGSVPEVHLPDHGDQAVFTLAILTGVIMLIAGLLKLGSLIRFVPNAVMTGFVNAVALLNFWTHSPTSVVLAKPTGAKTRVRLWPEWRSWFNCSTRR